MESACGENQSPALDSRWLYDTKGTYEAVDTRIFGKNLVKTRDGGEEDDGVHVIEKGNPGSYQK